VGLYTESLGKLCSYRAIQHNITEDLNLQQRCCKSVLCCSHTFFNTLMTNIHAKCIHSFGSYLTENTVHLPYKDQPLTAVCLRAEILIHANREFFIHNKPINKNPKLGRHLHFVGHLQIQILKWQRTLSRMNKQLCDQALTMMSQFNSWPHIHTALQEIPDRH
jgi:hypothetical protein